MVPADTHQAVDSHRVAAHNLVADTHRVAAHILVVDCYRDRLEVVRGDCIHHIDLVDLGLDPD